ncbi:TPA: hypothetical protein ACH3X1_011061 [Trebouxia sp. C0004]
MDANAPSGDAESADLVDLSKEDTSTSGRTRDLPDAQDQLMDLDALTSADEFQLAVNEWFSDLDAEDRLAGMENFPAYQDSSAGDNSEQPLWISTHANSD